MKITKKFFIIFFKLSKYACFIIINFQNIVLIQIKILLWKFYYYSLYKLIADLQKHNALTSNLNFYSLADQIFYILGIY